MIVLGPIQTYLETHRLPPRWCRPPLPGTIPRPSMPPPRPPRKYDYRWTCGYCGTTNRDKRDTCKGCSANR